MAGVETADCRFRRDGSLEGLLEACECVDPLFVELQLLGLREFDLLVVLYLLMRNHNKANNSNIKMI